MSARIDAATPLMLEQLARFDRLEDKSRFEWYRENGEQVVMEIVGTGNAVTILTEINGEVQEPQYTAFDIAVAAITDLMNAETIR